MAIREIYYTAYADGIYPKTEQRAGVQNEHNATCVKFSISDELKEMLKNSIDETIHFLYRFDLYDGAGGYHPSVASDLTFEDDYLEKYLTQGETEAGGQLQLYFIISKVPINATDEEALKPEFVFYTHPAYLILDPLPYGIMATKKTESDLSLLMREVAKQGETAKAIGEELLRKKNAGEFKGEKGEKGDKGDKGDIGDSYNLTDSDKADIANIVLAIMPDGDEVSY